ncbi:DUF1735 and LamG domain-containing protein [Bacteroides faecalis]|nr:DUF1735 and LamG domain-containing protein [Bacteroides faecalis]
MKIKNLNIRNLFAAGLLMLLVTNCNDANYDEIDSLVFLQETGTQANISKKVPVRDKNISIMVTPRIGEKAPFDLEVGLKADAAALKTFNQRNGMNLEMLPEEFYEFEQLKAKIEKGRTTASSVEVIFKPLSEELSQTGKQYALPVKAVAPEGMQTLEGADLMVYIVDPLIITSVPVINAQNNLKMTMRQDYSLTEWSVEYRISINKLGTKKGEMNNQAMFAAFGPGGDEIYTRFGDAQVEGNKLQIKNQGSQFNSNTVFATNTWYHIAFVCNGSKVIMYVNGAKDSELAVSGKTTNLSKDNFGFGNQDYLKADVKVSEIRFWTKAISDTQIMNNMFSIDPQTEGLEAYWRLNEGTGNEFKDATGNGNACRSTGKTEWVLHVKADNLPDSEVESGTN